jgi:hypothetical protein
MRTRLQQQVGGCCRARLTASDCLYTGKLAQLPRIQLQCARWPEVKCERFHECLIIEVIRGNSEVMSELDVSSASSICTCAGHLEDYIASKVAARSQALEYPSCCIQQDLASST